MIKFLLNIDFILNLLYTVFNPTLQKEEKTMDCLFCAIIKGEIPSKKLYEDEVCYAFADINPQAPVHCLIVPKLHIPSSDAVTCENSSVVAHIFSVIPKIAKELALSDGYRVITNVGENGCQSVKHLHFHILGGAKLSENMG